MLLLVFGIILGTFIYFKILKPNKYWDERGIAHAPSWPLIGNMLDTVLKRKHISEVSTDIYKSFPNDRYVGFLNFTIPVLLIRDLELIKQITIKEFDSFHDHMEFANGDYDPLLSKALINLREVQWKQMRATLSPVFTSSKMKNMFRLMEDCIKNLTDHLQDGRCHDVEMKEFIGKLATDVIASTAFGIQSNAVNEPSNEFYLMSKKLIDFNLTQVLKMILFQFVPKLAKVLHIRIMPQELADFYSKIILKNIEDRLKNNVVRPDLIHLLLEARKGMLKHDQKETNLEGFATVEESQIGKDTKQMTLTDDHIIAQAILFFFAGLDTMSNGSSSMAYELAVNPKVQAKLQEEIDIVYQKYNGKVTYEGLLSMKYMDQVVCETLRFWPPVFQTDRFCNTNLIVEPTQPSERRLVIEKGMLVGIPIIGIQQDPKYFPEPHRFDPERFSEENKPKITPGSYIPFGLGPRNCIGSRFALLEMKILFFYILAKFDIVPNEKTSIPFKLSPKKLNLSPENGFQLTLKPR